MKKLTIQSVFLLSFIIGFQLFSVSQNPNVIKDDYARNSLTMLVLDYGDSPYMNYFRTSGRLGVPDKFDNNNLSYTLLPANFSRDQMIDRTKGANAVSFTIKNKMNNNFIEPLYNLVKTYKIPNAIVAKEFNRQPDGSFNMDEIARRGMYNADVTDYQKAHATIRKDDALRDAGELLLNKSYILIFDFTSVKTMTEVYDAMDANSETKVKRTQNGYKATGNAYLYRIDFNDSVYNNFLLSMWIDANSDPALKQERSQLFDNNIFPTKRIANIPYSSEALQYNADQGVMAPKKQKTTEQLFEELVNESRDGVITNIEKLNDQFRVKAQITSVHPLGVKIGKKEGLKLDQRFFVYEAQLDASGKEFSKRMGVIRSKSVVENRNFISDNKGLAEPSIFFQTAGKKLSNMGMYVEQKNDWGFGLYIGYALGNMGGANVSLEYNIMSIFNTALNLQTGITSLKLYVTGGFDLKTYDLNISNLNLTDESVMFAKIEGGFAKDFYFARNFYIGPVVGMGMESASITDIDDTFGGTYDYSYQTLYGNAGLRFGFNILHNLQLQITGNYLIPFGTVTEDKLLDNESVSGYPIEIEKTWDEIFLDRKGLIFGGGLRLQF
jgi:hypothetical protein